MRKSRIEAVAFVILLAGTAVEAQVAVEILHMPSEVPSFGPLYVLYAVENSGASPLYLPAEEEMPENGHALFSAPAGEVPRRTENQLFYDRLFSHAAVNMWLAPGERWLFYRDMSEDLFRLEGEHSIQAVLSSDGVCGKGQEYGWRSFPLYPLYIETLRRAGWEAPIYRCWEGEARSSIRNVTVRRPNSPFDQEAFAYLVESGTSPRVDSVEDGKARRWRLYPKPGFAERFPESHYAYAMLARQWSARAKRRAVELQPGNPLNPWVMGALARQVLHSRSSCWEHGPLPFDLDVDELELPDGVREYLEQYEWYLENRHCPNKRAAEQERRELEERRRQEAASESGAESGASQ
jgi:hypothetical protein